MLIASLVLALAQAAPAPPPVDCATLIALGTQTAAAQICLGEAEFVRAQASPKHSAEWTRQLEAAATFYRRALALPGDEAVRENAIERLLVIFDSTWLNDADGMAATFAQLIALKPSDVTPLLRYAQFQERQGLLEAAEETLLSARRLRLDAVEPVRRLAQFYARRATALHAAANPEAAREQTPPGSPDKNGVYQVGGAVVPPRRVGNPVYPPEATAAGITGAVVAEITVNEAGVVTDARVLKSIPFLDDAALRAVKEWRYDPAIVNGKPAPIKMNVTVNFTLPK